MIDSNLSADREQDIRVEQVRLREAHDSGVPLLHKPVTPSQLYRTLVCSVPQRQVA